MTELLFKEDELYTVKEVARKLKVSKDAVKLWIRAKKLRAFKVGNAYRILGKDINDFIEVNIESK
jgi:excisionase family DNA binding protein